MESNQGSKAHLAVQSSIVACQLETGQAVWGGQVGIFLWGALKKQQWTRTKSSDAVWINNVPITYNNNLDSFKLRLEVHGPHPNMPSPSSVISYHIYDLGEVLLPLYLDEWDETDEQNSPDSD